MSQASLKLATAFLCTVLAACGGGGGDSPEALNSQSGSSTTDSPTGAAGDSTNPTPSTGSDNGNTASPPSQGTGNTASPPASSPAPITATVSAAPADGATISNTVRLEIRSNSIENAELLPPDAYAPRLGLFTVSADKTMAWLDFDTRTLPNGTLLARISAFDRPAGAAGATEVVAMSTRRWLLRNNPPPAPAQIPAASYMPEVHISNLALPYVDPQPLVDMLQLGDDAYDALLRDDWPQVESVMHRYLPPHVILMPPTPMGFSGPWDACMRLHTRLACREAMNNMAGLMMGKQP